MTAQEQIVGRPFANGNAHALLIQLIHVLKGGLVTHQIGAFDMHIGFTEANLFRTLGINRQKRQIPLVPVDRLYDSLGRIVAMKLHAQAQLLRHTARQVRRDPFGRLLIGTALGQDGIAIIHGNTQNPAGGQFCCDSLLLCHVNAPSYF